jgi:hypothetical protein
LAVASPAWRRDNAVAPLGGPLFVVGDAAGRLLASTLAADLTAAEARARCRGVARRTARFHALLARLQHVVAGASDGVRAVVAGAYRPRATFHPVMQR